MEKDELAKVVANLQAQLRELESKLEEFEHRASKERKANKELEEELLVFKKASMEQHEKGFYKVVRQVKFFTKDLDLGLVDPLKDMKDGELLDEEEIIVVEEDAGKEQGDRANV